LASFRSRLQTATCSGHRALDGVSAALICHDLRERREYRTLAAKRPRRYSPMASRPDSERIHAARRAANVRRLEGEGMSAARAEAWIARWEDVAAAEGRLHDQAYWQAARDWIAERSRPVDR
jgi:hypothetical protein